MWKTFRIKLGDSYGVLPSQLGCINVSDTAEYAADWFMTTDGCTLNNKPVDLANSIAFSVDPVFTLLKMSLVIVFSPVIRFVDNDTIRGAAMDGGEDRDLIFLSKYAVKD